MTMMVMTKRRMATGTTKTEMKKTRRLGQEMLAKARQEMEIRDATNTNLINLRRAIYLTIMSSLNFEECAHKLMKLGVREGQEIELSNMIKDCCSQERTYVNFFGLLGERFCRLGQNWANAFSQTFEESYNTIHRCETNRLRNTAKYFAHLLATDALPWTVMALIRLTEEDTTSASRIFVKILFEELNGSLGLARLKERLFDKNMVITVQAGNGGMETRSAFAGLFPLDNPRNTRFAINYFTSIKLGALTTEMREHLKNAPKLIMAQQQEVESSDESSSESSSDSDSNSDSSSDSDSDSDSGDSSSSGSDSDSSAGAKDSNSRKKKEEGKREAQSDGRTAIGDRGRNGSSRGEENGRSRRNGHDAIDRSTSERERNRDAERKGESGMNRSRGRDDVDRSRERGGGRQRDDSRLRERERERDRERDRESDRERDRDRDRDRDRERDRERNGRESERNGRRGDEDRERDRDRQRQSDRDKRR
ncbi:MA3 domain-containing protein [Zopfochytrium polystomum]|nr:MA3 domain-containing protein [Zopfochytrium polystomum]